MMANNIKPTRQKLHQYFSKSRNSPTQGSLNNWNAHDLDSVIKRANNMQAGSLVSPDSPISPFVQDLRNKPSLVCVGKEDHYEPRHGQKFELHYEPEPFVFDYNFLEPPGQMWHYTLAPPQYTPPSPPSPPPKVMHQPERRPPLPPALEIPSLVELPATEPAQPRPRRASSARKVKPAMRLRRAKTPVRRIGQLEAAAAKRRKDAAMGRRSSVRSVARKNSVLVVKTGDPEVPPVPPVPVIHRKALPLTALPYLHEFSKNYSRPHQSPSESQGFGLLEKPEPRKEATPSLASDTDTLVSFPDDSSYVKTPHLSSPVTPPFEQDYYVDDDYIKSPDTEVFQGQIGFNMLACELSTTLEDDFKSPETGAIERQIGFDMLARELSTTVEDDFKSPDTEAIQRPIGFDMLARELSTTIGDDLSRVDRDTSGLQIWVMIEAYERLRDKVSTMENKDLKLENARAAFDTWLDALRVIQRSIADEAAESESDYGDED